MKSKKMLGNFRHGFSSCLKLPCDSLGVQAGWDNELCFWCGATVRQSETVPTNLGCYARLVFESPVSFNRGGICRLHTSVGTGDTEVISLVHLISAKNNR